MATIFISHSSRNSEQAIQVRNWLAVNGWQDVFLDLDPERGIVAGQRWKEALQKAAHRCELVLALVSPDWVASAWCKSEIDAARLMGKKIIVALVGIDKGQVPQDLADEQWIDLVGDSDGYRRLKAGLKHAGLDPSNFVLESGRAPYPGFAFLEEKDAAVFFGRDAQIIRALDKMRGLVRVGVDRMLFILGASGSGKSSFLRAGLRPRLARDDRTWLPLPVIRPERAVISGKFGLAQALHQVMNAGPFAEQFRQRRFPRSLAETQRFVTETKGALREIFGALREFAYVPELSEKSGQSPTIVVAVDQGEELFNEEGRSEAELFVKILSEALKADAGVLALVAMRSDAFPQVQNHPQLADLPKDTFTLDMMLEGSYRAVIEGPARLVEPPLKIDPQVVDALLEDVSGQDALPLLAFTLAHLYERYVADNELSLTAYEKLGRLKGVIDTTIGEAFDQGVARGKLPKDAKAQLALARRAFIPHLAQVNAAGLFVRRVATYAEIPVESRAVIDCFAESRLLIKDRRKIAGNDVEVIEVAHEAVLRQPPISDWLVEDREFLIWRERLSQACVAFKANERGLLAGRELQIARDWVQRRVKGEIPLLDESFIEKSVEEYDRQRAKEEERERQRHAAELEAAQVRELAAQERANAALRVARLTKRWLVFALVLFVVAGLTAWFAWLSKNEAVEARSQATKNEKEAQKNLAKSQIAQSRWLINKAEHTTDQSERILLALEALPNSQELALEAPQDAKTTKMRPLFDAAREKLFAYLGDFRDSTTVMNHHEAINCVAMTTDGSRIVSGSDDQTVRLWDAKGAELRQFLGHTAPVRSVAITSDGSRIVSSSDDQTVRLWDAKGAELRQFLGHTARVTSVAMTSDGTRIVSSSDDRTVRIWDPKEGELRQFDGHTSAVNSVAITPDGRHIATGSSDGMVRLFNSAGTKIKDFKAGGSVSSVVVTPDGKLVAAGASDGIASLWETKSGDLVAATRRTDAVDGVVLTERGLVTVSEMRVRLWDPWNTEVPQQMKELLQMNGHTGTVRGLAATQNELRIVTSSDDKTMRLWDKKILSDDFASSNFLPKLIELANKAVPRCFDIEERGDRASILAPPGWCIDLSKPPYDTQLWKDWKAGKAVEDGDIADTIGSYAERLLFEYRDYDKALEAAELGLKFAPKEKAWIIGNKAHALMYLGETEKACRIYLDRRHLGMLTPAGKWEGALVGDFKKLREIGHGHGPPLMAVIEKVLMGEAPPDAEEFCHGLHL